MGDGRLKREERVTIIPVIQISVNKCQSRRSFDKEKIRCLSKSIEENGILHPLTVRRVSPFEYELISGERRLRAAVLAGMSAVPCAVIHCSQRQSAVYSLVENVQRENLTFFEQAEAIKLLLDEFSFNEERLAQQIGGRRSVIIDKLRLLDFSQEEREIIEKFSLSESHAQILLMIDDVKLRKKVLNMVVENGLNVGQTEDVVQRLISPKSQRKSVCKQTIVIKDIRLFYNTIKKAVTTMRKSGINATEEKTETDNFIEYRIRIEK